MIAFILLFSNLHLFFMYMGKDKRKKIFIDPINELKGAFQIRRERTAKATLRIL